MLHARVIITTGVTRIAPSGSSDAGIVTPKVESSGPPALLLGVSGDSPATPTVAAIYRCHCRVEHLEQRQYEQALNGMMVSSVFATCIPVAPLPGTVLDRYEVVHLLAAAETAGNYDIGDATTFATAQWVLPAVDATADLDVASAEGFAVDSIVAIGIGVICQVTGVATGKLTLKNTGAPCAILSVGA